MATVPKPPVVKDTVDVHGTRKPSYIVLHTTEGLGTIESYARYFRGNGLGSSYLTERSGRIGEYVRHLTDTTWHVKSHNSQCIGIEQQGFANTSRLVWMTKYRVQLWAAAWLLAWLSQELGIPLIAAGSDRARGFTHSKGVSQHKWIPDNDHNDCGPGYPFDYVLKKAQYWLKRGGPHPATKAIIARSVRKG